MNWIIKLILFFSSEEKKEQYFIMSLKSNLLFFGYDITNMTDKEIKAGLNRIHCFLQHSGVSFREMSENLKALSGVGIAASKAGENMRNALIELKNKKSKKKNKC